MNMKNLKSAMIVLFLAALAAIPLAGATRTGSTGTVDVTWDSNTGGLIVWVAGGTQLTLDPNGAGVVNARLLTMQGDANTAAHNAQGDANLVQAKLDAAAGDANTRGKLARDDANTAAHLAQGDANLVETKLDLLRADSNAMRAANDYVISAIYPIIADGNSRFLTDPNTGGPASFPASTVCISLVPDANATTGMPEGTIQFVLSGTASATSCKIPPGGLAQFRVTPTVAGTIKIFAASVVKGSLYVGTSR